MDNSIYENEKKELKTKYFDSSDALCKFVNDERQKGEVINVVSIIPLGGGSAYRLFYETY
jgi:hypothetical protein